MGMCYTFIQQRRTARVDGNRVKEKNISKRIQQETKAATRKHKKHKVEHLLTDFQGLKQISGILSGGKQDKICEVLDPNKEIITHVQDIADTFASLSHAFSRCFSS